MSQVFYFPGKAGDSLHQWPIAYWWHRQHREPFECWIDEPSSKMLEPLFAAQPGVSKVVLTKQSANYNCGGQPWGGDFSTELHQQHNIVSLGFRAFPQRQLTLQTLNDVPLKLNVTHEELAETPSLAVPDEPKANRVMLHGTGVCPHTKQTPAFWRFLARLDLSEFDEIEFIGSPDDREVGKTAYPEHGEFDDGGDLLKLASRMNASRLVLACGSAMAALAQQLKVPCVRVHDPLGEAAKVIWSGLGKNQLNDTEFGLRTSWPEFHDKWIKQESECRSR